MNDKNKIEYRVYGEYALFTDPLTKTGGEKFTYQIPTYEALRGITESIYWKPVLNWVIDEVRIINPIRTQVSGMRPLEYEGGNTLAYYTYLRKPEYRVRAHFEWNLDREDLAQDRNENKHYYIAKRMLERGGRRDIFLGTRECQGYAEPCGFEDGEGAYDGTDMDFSLMFHGFDYPSVSGGMLCARFFTPHMQNGAVRFPRPEECVVHREIRATNAVTPLSSGSAEPGLLDGYQEG